MKVMQPPPPRRRGINAPMLQETAKPEVKTDVSKDTKDEAAIPWYATLSRGLAEAKRTGKPILFVSAAPHCAGVSGMW